MAGQSRLGAPDPRKAHPVIFQAIFSWVSSSDVDGHVVTGRADGRRTRCRRSQRRPPRFPPPARGHLLAGGIAPQLGAGPTNLRFSGVRDFFSLRRSVVLHPEGPRFHDDGRPSIGRQPICCSGSLLTAPSDVAHCGCVPEVHTLNCSRLLSGRACRTRVSSGVRRRFGMQADLAPCQSEVCLHANHKRP